MKSVIFQTLALLSSILVAFVLLQIPLTRNYALQIFSGSILILLLIRKVKKGEMWQILPDKTTLEMPFLTLSFLILIGATGGLNSSFFVLIYVLLFLFAIALKANSAISATVAVMIFFFAINPDLSNHQIVNLISLPLLLVFFLFAKKQFDESQTNKALLEEEVTTSSKSSATASDLTSFIKNFLKPKLKTIANHAQEKDSTLEETVSQISLLDSETDKLLDQVEKETKDQAQKP